MSIQRLLVDFPNYSARKIRRLAKQLSFLDEALQIFAVGEMTGVAKGIAQDLEELNLLRAEKESQLNDDLAISVSIPDRSKAEGQVSTLQIHVCPTLAAHRALDELLAYAKIHSDIAVDKESFSKLIEKCNGIINGQSFYADRAPIQARLSPQGDLPLNQGD